MKRCGRALIQHSRLELGEGPRVADYSQPGTSDMSDIMSNTVRRLLSRV